MKFRKQKYSFSDNRFEVFRQRLLRHRARRDFPEGISGGTTLARALDLYVNEVTASKRGRAQELSLVRIWQRSSLAALPLSRIRAADVARVRDSWLATFKPATVVRRLALLSHVFVVGRKEWGLETLQNPVSGLRKPRVGDTRTRRIRSEPLTGSGFADELDRILAATRARLLPAIVRLAVATAMRRGELAALRWEHVDLRAGVAHLPATKNGHARDVPLSPRALAVFARLDASERGRVFPVRADTITRAFDRARQRARRNYEAQCRHLDVTADPDYLCDLRFHDLRHEAVSQMADLFALHELARVTGHTDPRMLMRYYHPRAQDLALRMARPGQARGDRCVTLEVGAAAGVSSDTVQPAC